MARAMGKRTNHNGRSPQLLERTFAVLSLFTPTQPQWTTTEIARACRVPVPTIHRIMVALHEHGFVDRDEMTKRFRLGQAALELGRNARASTDLRSVGLPMLRQLAIESGETVVLTVPSESRDRSVCIERVESTQPLRLSVEPGRDLPLHAGASAKILLAFMPVADRERNLQAPLARLCRATIVDPDALRRELQKIRGRGWASSFEETNVGACGVAIALLDGANHAVASVGVAGPRARVRNRQLKDWLELLQDSAEELSSRTGLATSVRYAADEKLRGRTRTTAKG